jgi:uncharacterized membrane protein YkoI
VATGSRDRLSRQEAIGIALATVGGGTPTEAELKQERGALAWDVEFRGDGRVLLDATTGRVLQARMPRVERSGSGSGRLSPRDDD